MAKKKKFYVVWKGKHPGIFETWDDCKAQITGYKGAQYKSFSTFAKAKKAFNGNYSDYTESKTKVKKLSQEEILEYGVPNFHSISVDAASSGNPGVMEYQGVDTKTKKVFFKQGPFKQGTNNIGEFLALVHGLAYLKRAKKRPYHLYRFSNCHELDPQKNLQYKTRGKWKKQKGFRFDPKGNKMVKRKRL